jgi:hypothetical protein
MTSLLLYAVIGLFRAAVVDWIFSPSKPATTLRTAALVSTLRVDVLGKSLSGNEVGLIELPSQLNPEDIVRFWWLLSPVRRVRNGVIEYLPVPTPTPAGRKVLLALAKALSSRPRSCEAVRNYFIAEDPTRLAQVDHMFVAGAIAEVALSSFRTHPLLVSATPPITTHACMPGSPHITALRL